MLFVRQPSGADGWLMKETVGGNISKRKKSENTVSESAWARSVRIAY